MGKEAFTVGLGNENEERPQSGAFVVARSRLNNNLYFVQRSLFAIAARAQRPDAERAPGRIALVPSERTDEAN